MPNHIHGIVNIKNPVGDGHARPYYKNNKLSIIIGSFKSAVSKKINIIYDGLFKWQRSYYDNVIRTTNSLHKIRQYIKENPSMWAMDENNIVNYQVRDKACLVPTGTE